MQSGYTCRSCLKSLKGASSTNFAVSHSRSLIDRPWQSTTRRHVQTGARAQPIIPVQQKRSLTSQELSKSYNPGLDKESLNYKRVYRAGPGDLKLPNNEDLEEDPRRVLLKPDNLFHSFSNSPAPDLRRKAAFMKMHAYCPHPDHRQTRVVTSPNDPEARKVDSKSTKPPAHVNFECPDCGLPVYCSEEHWMDDYEYHIEMCDTLRMANEDEHDLRSGRFYREFEYPGPQLDDILPNMTSWDTFMYTREFNAVNDDRHMRQVTRLLTYPITIGSVLHELSPYNIRKGGRLTPEGLKSLSGTY